MTPMDAVTASENPPFEISNWIGKGKTMSAMPRQVHNAAKAEFDIPEPVRYEILPSPMLPTAKMVEFPMPLETTNCKTRELGEYFSLPASDLFDKMMLSRLSQLAIPEAKIIRKLKDTIGRPGSMGRDLSCTVISAAALAHISHCGR